MKTKDRGARKRAKQARSRGRDRTNECATMMASHVDQLSGSACSIECSLDDRFRQTDERVDSTIG